MKYISKRNKRMFTKIYQTAKAKDLNFSQARKMSLIKHQLSLDKHLAKKEGTYLCWSDCVFDGLMLMVSVRTQWSHREVGLKIYLSKEEVPPGYKCLWQKVRLSNIG
mgnify:CR=1 FL=1